ncbi:MAG: ankyrin repeat domain-containing protein [Deltaproteobacteria bacterium]|nr:ankyrin repeat domain-containing protein [Deltaproteobacteria bacterium]
MRPCASLTCLLVCACALRPDPGPRREPPPASPCGEPAFTVQAPSPEEGAPQARLTVNRLGEGMSRARRATCLVAGGERLLVLPGERGEIAIAAHPEKVQRLEVDGRIYLVWIPPAGELGIVDHPCYDWTFSAIWLDPFFQEPPIAYCREPDQACKPGTAQAGPPGPVEDPLCAIHLPDGDSERRCVRRAGVRFPAELRAELPLFRPGPPGSPRETPRPTSVPDPSRPTSVPRLDGQALSISPDRLVSRYFGLDPILPPASCSFPGLELGDEKVWLAIGPGARWTVHMGAGGRIEALAEELHAAATDGEQGRLRQLLALGARVDARSATGKTPLLYAAGAGRAEAARLLLARGADVQSRDPYGATSLHWATVVPEKGAALIELLIQAGADPDARDRDGRTALHTAVDLSREDCRDFPDGEIVGFEEESALAAVMARALLDRGASIEARDARGRTPLHAATEAGNSVLVELLIERGAKKDAKDSRGTTPLDIARESQAESVIRLLER